MVLRKEWEGNINRKWIVITVRIKERKRKRQKGRIFVKSFKWELMRMRENIRSKEK